VPYNGKRYPGAPGVSGLEGGANCQLFAYELLRANGRSIGDLRSSNLWEDTRDTFVVTEFAPLDLLLLNRTSDPYGAHVAVWLGGGRAIHLSKAVGKPATWTLAEFALHERYQVLIGAKRTRH
jgi:hypothetical protein